MASLSEAPEHLMKCIKSEVDTSVPNRINLFRLISAALDASLASDNRSLMGALELCGMYERCTTSWTIVVCDDQEWKNASRCGQFARPFCGPQLPFTDGTCELLIWQSPSALNASERELYMGEINRVMTSHGVVLVCELSDDNLAKEPLSFINMLDWGLELEAGGFKVHRQFHTESFMEAWCLIVTHPDFIMPPEEDLDGSEWCFLDMENPFVPPECDIDPLPSFHDWRKTCPELGVLLENIDEIREEAEHVAKSRWKPWPEEHYSDGGSQDWKVFPFCHTFPSNIPENRHFIESTCHLCPRTTAILKSVPTIRTALFSRLGPQGRISAHTGWAELANYVLRGHLPLVLPKGNKCGLWVEGEVRCQRENELLVFDDSKLHKAANESDEMRIILLIDVARPPGVPLGRAKGERTPELESVLEYFK